MRRFNPLVLVAVLAAYTAAFAQTPRYGRGRPPTAEEIRAWDITVGPAGKELPAGSGTAKQGAPIYAARCAICHGPTGKERTAKGGESALVGGQGTIGTLHPNKTIGSYWPFATTIWDYINRAMPLFNEGSLSASEVYSLTALLLYRNGIIKEDDVIDSNTLPKIQMPNRDGFVPPRERLTDNDRVHGCPTGHCP